MFHRHSSEATAVGLRHARPYQLSPRGWNSLGAIDSWPRVAIPGPAITLNESSPAAGSAQSAHPLCVRPRSASGYAILDKAWAAAHILAWLIRPAACTLRSRVNVSQNLAAPLPSNGPATQALASPRCVEAKDRAVRDDRDARAMARTLHAFPAAKVGKISGRRALEQIQHEI